jgi:hypothetical protein
MAADYLLPCLSTSFAFQQVKLPTLLAGPFLFCIEPADYLFRITCALVGRVIKCGSPGSGKYAFRGRLSKVIYMLSGSMFVNVGSREAFYQIENVAKWLRAFPLFTPPHNPAYDFAADMNPSIHSLDKPIPIQGFPRVADKIAHDPDNTSTIFRRFDRLSARNLLFLEA